MSELNEWDELSAEDISQEDFDQAVREYAEARDKVADMETQLKPLKAEKTEKENKVLAMLAATKKEKYHVADVGLVFTATRTSVTTPKNIEDKQKLFDYIEEKYGRETLMDYLSVNSQRLNSFFKQEDDLATQDGIADFKLPGVGDPASFTQLRFKK